MSKRPLTFALLSLFLVVSAFPATVSVMVVESGLGEDAPPAQASSAWEAAIMDALFEGGQIVSNAPPQRSAELGLPDPTYGWGPAREGGIGYVVVISLEYPTPPSAAELGQGTGVRLSPKAARYRITEVDGQTLLEGEKTQLPPTTSGDEDAKNAREVARIIVDGLKGR